MSNIHNRTGYQPYFPEGQSQSSTDNLSDESQRATISKIESKIASEGILAVSTEHVGPIPVDSGRDPSFSPFFRDLDFLDQPSPFQEESKVSTSVYDKDRNLEELESLLMAHFHSDQIEEAFELIKEIQPEMINSDLVNAIFSLRDVEQGDVESAKDKVKLIKDYDLWKMTTHKILRKLLEGNENEKKEAVAWIIAFDKNMLMPWTDVLQSLKKICFKITHDGMLIVKIFKKIYPSDIAEREKGIKLFFSDLLHFPPTIAVNVFTISEGMKSQVHGISNLSVLLYRSNYKEEAFELLNQLSYLKYPLEAFVAMARRESSPEEEVKVVGEIALHIKSEEVRLAFSKCFIKKYEKKKSLNGYLPALKSHLGQNQPLSGFQSIMPPPVPLGLNSFPQTYPQYALTLPVQPPSLPPFPQQQMGPCESFPSNPMQSFARPGQMGIPVIFAKSRQQLALSRSHPVQGQNVNAFTQQSPLPPHATATTPMSRSVSDFELPFPPPIPFPLPLPVPFASDLAQGPIPFPQQYFRDAASAPIKSEDISDSAEDKLKRRDKIKDLLSEYFHDGKFSDAMDLINNTDFSDLVNSSEVMQKIAIRYLEQENYVGAEQVVRKIFDTSIRSSILYCILTKYCEKKLYLAAAQVLIGFEEKDFERFPQTITKICLNIKDDVQLVVGIIKKITSGHREYIITKLFEEYLKIGGDYQLAIDFSLILSKEISFSTKYLEEIVLLLFRKNDRQKAFTVANQVLEPRDRAHVFFVLTEKGSPSSGPITFEDMEAMAPQITDEMARSLYIFSCIQKYQSLSMFENALSFAENIPSLEIKELAISGIRNTMSFYQPRKRMAAPTHKEIKGQPEKRSKIQ